MTQHSGSVHQALSLGLGNLNRRRLIGRLAAAGFSAPLIASIVAHQTAAQEATPTGTPSPQEVLTSLGKDPGLIPQGTTTFETPVELMDEFLTPNDRFFIRSNGPVAIVLDPTAWRLSVTGLVNTELDLSLADLQAMPQRTIAAFLECSGDSRGRFGDDPQQVDGTQWGNGAIGNAEWTGVALVEILNQAGVQEGAVDILSQGGDFEDMQRGLPLEIALDPDVMLVWEMNGEALPAVHGGPVRLLVPGWGGIASTKWIVGLELIDRAFDGTFNVDSYVVINGDGTIVEPVTIMPVKSVITSPVPEASLSAGTQTIGGFAWSGHGSIALLEVSTDGGETWAEAQIVEEAGRLSWVRFEYVWEAGAGEAVLSSRATDERGLQQPREVAWNAKGYGMNAIYNVPVTIS